MGVGLHGLLADFVGGAMSDDVDRHKDIERNKILNRAMSDLGRIINDHDPEIDTSISNGVWDRLDKLALEIEARAAIAAMPPREVGENPTVAQLHSACLSYRHDYGLMKPAMQAELHAECLDWWRCIARALAGDKP